MPSIAQAEPTWTWSDTAWEAAFAAAVIVDVRQTSTALATGRVELNPVMGRRPSDGRLAAAAAIAVGAHALISTALPPEHRRWWQAVSLAAEGTAVGHNFAVGARLTF
jgi:6-phosphofructokinase